MTGSTGASDGAVATRPAPKWDPVWPCSSPPDPPYWTEARLAELRAASYGHRSTGSAADRRRARLAKATDAELDELERKAAAGPGGRAPAPGSPSGSKHEGRARREPVQALEARPLADLSDAELDELERKAAAAAGSGAGR